MQSNNPVLGRTFGSPTSTAYRAPAPSAEQLEQMYQAPPAVQPGRMTYDEVVTKTGILLAIVVAGAVVGWMAAPSALTMVGLVVGLVLGLVNAFKKEPSPPLMMAYAAFMGLFLGGISFMFENMSVTSDQPLSGIVAQAILGTMSVFAVALWAYRTKRIRVTPKFQRGVLIAGGAYLVFCIVNLLFMWLGSGSAPLGFRSGTIGVLIGLFAIGLAAMFLILDFDFIEKGVQQGIPAKYAWTAAFGLTVTLIWLYIEMLRLLAILRGD
jgi:uncharacterized YccA/Bax inhibitor family protein